MAKIGGYRGPRPDTAARNRKHGLWPSPEYNAWQDMRQRCLNPNDNRYKHYGARGIKFCDEWEDFSAFYAVMGPRPTPQHSLDRIHNDGNYGPDNCRWATRSQQRRNMVRTSG